MSDINRTKHIAKFGGNIWYINKGSGDDTKSGKSPTQAFETIGAGITAMADGDALNVKAGIYTEVGLNLSNDYAEIWFEIGTQLTPATGTALTISGASCKITGKHKITAVAGQIGILVSGTTCALDSGRVVGGGVGLSITGVGTVIKEYGAAMQTVTSYDITGGQTKLYDCSTLGVGATYGYKINGGADTGVLRGCTSVGHATAGYYIDTLSENWTILNCTSGAGDGRWQDVDNANVWSNFSPEEHIPKFGGTIWFINKGTGSDTNSGLLPTDAFETIGEGITRMADGDAISVKAGTYTETGLNLSNTAAEMWFHIGVKIEPASGTGLIVSGDYCALKSDSGSALITVAANQTGLQVTGDFCDIADIRVSCGSVADIGIEVTTTATGTVIHNCRPSSPLVAAFKISGDKTKIHDSNTGSIAANTSIGYWVTDSCDKTRIFVCSSQGHITASVQVDTGCTNGSVVNFSSGGGDGRWSDADNSFVWSNFTYNDEAYSDITFAGAATTYNIYKITGAVKITNINGHVDTVMPNTSSDIHLELYSTGGTIDLTNNISAPDLDTIPVGSLLIKKGDSTDVLEICSSATPCLVEFGTKDPEVAFIVTEDADQDTYIRLNITAALASGAIHWHCNWSPLTDDGFLAAA